MPRRFDDRRLLVASHNPGKVREIGDLLRPFGVQVLSAAELDAPEPEENGATFIENAMIKSLSGAKHAGFPALSDDSGLVVPALDGAPGLYSARWAGPTKDFKVAMTRVWDELEARQVPQSDRRAYFICALSLAWPDGHVENFEGRIDGRLIWPIRGEKGFGYDPMFVPDGYDITFGEMDSDAKHKISHRARAFAQLVDACFNGR